MSFPENGNNGSNADNSFNHLVGSNYYESNDEVFCIDTNDVRNIKTQGNEKQPIVNMRVENMKKIDDIKSYYKIGFDGQDLLGNGAFAMVRLGSKVVGQISGLHTNDSSCQNLNSKLSTYNTDNKYAIKMMRKSHIDTNKIYRGLLDNEIEILRDLNHPRCMKIHELFEDEKNYYVVSEYIQGGSVMRRLKENGKPYTEWTTYLIAK